MSSKKRTRRSKDHPVYEFEAKSPAYKLFILQKRLDYIRNKIRTADEWIPGLVSKKPKIDPKKVLSELSEQQSTLEKDVSKSLEEVQEHKLIFQKPFSHKGIMIQKYGTVLHEILSQATYSRQLPLTSTSCEDYFQYTMLAAAEFREYKDAGNNGVNNKSMWALQEGYLYKSTIIDADGLYFDASAFPVPNWFWDYPNYIWTAGLLKFNFPVAPCDTVIEWDAFMHIFMWSYPLVRAEGDSVDIDLVIREQPDSTSFPDVGLDDPGWEWVSFPDLHFSYSRATFPGTTFKHINLTGEFQVAHGMTSSLIIGPSLFVASSGEWASIGREDNVWDDGRFYFNGDLYNDLGYIVAGGPEDLRIRFMSRPQ